MTESLMEGPFLVTGGAGFIGSAFVRRVVRAGHNVTVLDSLTYAGRRENLADVLGNRNCVFIQGDICNPVTVRDAFQEARPGVVVHFAAESHVDRSIEAPGIFIRTNVVGTQVMLDAALDHFASSAGGVTDDFRFVHISTDEVFGSLGPEGYFNEETPYAPRSPYSASKAASDHLVNAWSETYGLPVSIINCTNNYGPYQFPEKFIPHIILSAIAGRSLPIYGDGAHIRDWLFVDDHCAAIEAVIAHGALGRSYCVGGEAERTNLQVAEAVADLLDELAPAASGNSHRDAIICIPDRLGHDRRYAMDIARISGELGWSPARDFAQGLRQTVQWYLENRAWWGPIVGAGQGVSRLGLGRQR